MEVLQQGYLHAVAAAAGCTLSSPFPDRGFDWTLSHGATAHTIGPEATIKVALKATAQLGPRPAGHDFPFALKNEHLAKLSWVDPTIPSVLVVMILPQSKRHWIFATGDLLQLRHCCYWINLDGHAVRGEHTTTVRVRTDHIFDDVSLCAIMQQVGQGVVPR
jgi:hypothetical protein